MRRSENARLSIVLCNCLDLYSIKQMSKDRMYSIQAVHGTSAYSEDQLFIPRGKV